MLSLPTTNPDLLQSKLAPPRYLISPDGCSVWKKKSAALETAVSQLTDKNDDLENRSRRNNLVVYGLEEPVNETPASLLDSVTELLTRKLSVTCDAIERCHRLGIPAEGKIRPVIFKLIDFRDKILILKNVSKLKGTRIFVNEDFSPRIRGIRKQLWLSTAEFRRNGAKVRLRYDHALVNNDRYSWDSTNNMLIKVLPPVLATGTN